MNITNIDQEPPKIEFPCDYPIKVMGFAVGSFRAQVMEIIHRHALDVPHDCITERISAKGNYISITVVIQATGEDQLKSLFEELKLQEHVKLVL